MTEEKTTLCPRCEALHVLGLGMDGLENDIRSAYHLLVKVWHADHFKDDPKLKEAAETKLKDIHAAFDFLTMTSTDRADAKRPVYLSTQLSTPPPPEAVPDTPAFSASNARILSALISNAAPPQGTVPKVMPIYQRAKWIIAIAAILFVLLIGGSIGMFLRTHPPASRQSAQNVSFLEKIEQEVRSLAPGSAAPEAGAPAAAPAPQNAAKPEKTYAAAHPALPATIKLKPYVTAGSTREEVLAQQGPPTASSEDKLVYGKSELYLQDDAVVGWRIDPATPLRVKLWAQTRVDPDTQSFTVGSSKDEVLVVQGTPTAFSEDQFEYGRSIVYFQNNRVVRWKSEPGSVILFAR
ncbi:MAG: J domain-containing protein [Terracidiphilus sp.]